MQTKTIVFTLEPTHTWVSESTYPVPASNDIPKWYKDLPSYLDASDVLNKKNSVTIKRCMPVFDSISSGYLIKTHTDLVVKRNKETNVLEFYWAFDTRNTVMWHDKVQITNYKNKNIVEDAPKWINPWSIQTSKNVSVLIVPPLHRPSCGIKIMEAIVDTDTYTNPINFPFFVDEGFEGEIPAGTPIAQIIPFERHTYQMEIGNDENRKMLIKNRAELQKTWIGAYRKIFRTVKEYK